MGALKPGFEKEKSKFDKVNNGSEVIEKYCENYPRRTIWTLMI